MILWVYSAITNGYDLAYYEDLLGENMIRMLQITVDGCEEQHNKRRIHHSDKDTFSTIISNIGIALKRGTSVAIRVNTDANNISDLESLNNLFDELRYSQYKTFSVNSALLVDYSGNTNKLNQNKAKVTQELNYMK